MAEHEKPVSEEAELSVTDVFSEKEKTSETPKGGEAPERDEHGRFKAKAEEPEGKAVEEPAKAAESKTEAPEKIAEAAKTEPPKRDEPTHQVPLAELLSERDKRQEAERRSAAAERELEATRRTLADIGRKPMPKAPALPDPIQEPEAYHQAVERNLERQMQVRFARQSIARAHRVHGEAFVKAFQAFDQSGDEALFNRVHSSDDPGEEILAWHRREETLREIGSDIGAYRKGLLAREDFRKEALADEAFVTALLADPAIRKRVIDGARAEAEARPASERPNGANAPSLSRATGSPAGREPTELRTVNDIFAAR